MKTPNQIDNSKQMGLYKKTTLAVLLCFIFVFSLSGCNTSADTYCIKESGVAEAFASYPEPQTIYDKVKDTLENYAFDTTGLTKYSTEDGIQYLNYDKELIYEVTDDGDVVIFHTVDADNNPVSLEYYSGEFGQTSETVRGINYKITDRRELTIYGKERELIYYVLENGIWNMSEATYYDDKGMETYFFEKNRLFAELSDGETVTMDEVLTDERITALEFKIGLHRFSVVEEEGKHILYLTADIYAVFNDKQEAENFAAEHNGFPETWKYGYYTVVFENTTLRLDDNCDNLDYNTPEDGTYYFRTAVLNEKGEIKDFTFDGPVLAK